MAPCPQVPFLDILAVRHGFAALSRLGGVHRVQVRGEGRRGRGAGNTLREGVHGKAPSHRGAQATSTLRYLWHLYHNLALPPVVQLRPPPARQAHVACLTEWLYGRLAGARHSNGAPLAALFGKHHLPQHRQVGPGCA